MPKKKPNTKALEQLLKTLQAVAAPAAEGPPKRDAIDDILGAAPRTTAAASLRDDPIMQRFRAELADGMVRIDTVNALLKLINNVLAAVKGIA